MTKFHRTLIRVTHVREEDFSCRIIGWRPNKVVRLSKKDVPFEVCPRTYLIAKANIGVESADELLFKEWELAPEPDPDDGLA